MCDIVSNLRIFDVDVITREMEIGTEMISHQNDLFKCVDPARLYLFPGPPLLTILDTTSSLPLQRLHPKLSSLNVVPHKN